MPPGPKIPQGGQGTGAGRQSLTRDGLPKGGGLVTRQKVPDDEGFSPEPGGRRAPRGSPSAARLAESELRRLQDATREAVPEARRKVALSLMRNCAWMKAKLDEARAELMGQGLVIDYDNGGGQSGVRENPGFSAYNKLFASYSRSVKQLTDLMAPGEGQAKDELAAFMEENRL